LPDETEILAQAEDWRHAGAGVAIATVVETFGSRRALLARISSSTTPDGSSVRSPRVALKVM
jgi:hypothetical protein